MTCVFGIWNGRHSISSRSHINLERRNSPAITIVLPRIQRIRGGACARSGGKTTLPARKKRWIHCKYVEAPGLLCALRRQILSEKDGFPARVISWLPAYSLRRFVGLVVAGLIPGCRSDNGYRLGMRTTNVTKLSLGAWAQRLEATFHSQASRPSWVCEYACGEIYSRDDGPKTESQMAGGYSPGSATRK